MNQILTDEEVSVITGIGFEATGRAIEQAILNKLSEQKPFGYYENGRWSIVTDDGPDKWRARRKYTGPLYTHTAPSVPKGWTAIHLKTGNEYQVIGEAIDATNMHCNQLMVIYQRDGKTFVREAEEFQEKFKASVSAAAYIGKTLK